MMTPEKWNKVREIYHSAVELDVEDLSEYLDKVCKDDRELRAEVESLLDADARAGDFISVPIVDGPPRFQEKEGEELRPGEMVAHYRIERSLGSGGMGEVYLAADTRLGRPVALKTLPTEMSDDPAYLKRFRNEALASANINHPNAAVVYSVEEYEGKPFLTMEYIDGQTLDSEIPPDGLPIDKFADWFAALADALAHAHAKGVIHRDVKPGNIMIADGKIPKILDFGLAQIDRRAFQRNDSDIHITTPGQIIGTPSYMSPEQAEGREVDHRSDIFSFGVVMYEALTGKRPFPGDSNAEIVSNLLRSEPPSINEIRPDVPEAFRRVIERCLRKRRAERYQSMSEVAEALSALRNVARSGRSFDSFQRRLFREARTPSVAWIPVAGVLIIVAAVAAWYYFAGAEAPPISFADLSFTKLSRSNNVAYAAISPDGRSVAYVTYEENGDRALWLRRVSDANSLQIVPPQQLEYWDCPAFSSDGEYVYFITAQRSATHGTMYRVPTLGGQPRKVVEKVNHLGNFSPDGRRILFVRYGASDPNRSINIEDAKLMSANAVDGSDEQVHKTVQGEAVIREPRFSSDGRAIYFVRRDLDDGVENWSIIVFDPLTSNESVLIRQRERIGELAVLHDRRALLMNATDPISNRRQLFYVALPNGKVTRVTNDINTYIGVSIDLASKTIVAAQRTEEARVFVGDSDDMFSMAAFSREPLGHQTVDWTPDGRIVYDVYENNRLTIRISDPDGRNPLQLTPPDSDNSEPCVSGDGRYIVFTSQRSGGNQIWRMNIDGSNPILLANVPGITQRPRFAADGRTVVFRWYNEGSAPMGEVSVEGGPVKGLDHLPRALSYYWAMSPDGRRIAYSTSESGPEELKVIVRPTEAEGPAYTLDIWPSRIFKWMPDSKTLVYQERHRGENLRAKVFTIEPESGKPKMILTAEPDELMDIAFSRDGRRFAVVRGRVMTDAVMLSSVSGSDR